MGKNFDIIQIGAHVGNTINDRKLLGLYNEKSNCIFIEPVKRFYDLLVNNHNKTYINNNFTFLNIACSNYIGELGLYEPDLATFSDESLPEYLKHGYPQWLDQLTSVHPHHIKTHGLNIKTKLINVQCTTLSEIVKKYEVKELNYLFVDTEGHDFEVINGLNFDILKPKNIIFEHSHMEGSCKVVGEKYNSLLSKLYGYGYIKTHMDDMDTHLKLKNNENNEN